MEVPPGPWAPGERFGEIALLRDVPHSAIVRATTALTLRGLSRATFVTAVAGCSPSADAVDDVIDGHLARFMPTQLVMNEVIPGILHWQARHPNIGVDVSSYLLLDSGTLLDPMLPEGAGRDWIGHQVERVILTVRHHDRSAGVFGVPVFVHRFGLYEFDGSGLDVRGYEAGDELARGITVLPFGRICPDDAVLKIDIGPGVLAFGDGLLNYGGLGHPPDRYIGDDPEAIKADIVEGLVPFVDEDFDVLLFAHGTPVASGGKAMLREFVEERRGISRSGE